MNIDKSEYQAPNTKYFKTKQDFDIAVGKDFINLANDNTDIDKTFLVGLSHGQSPSGAYQYIFNNFDQIIYPQNLYFTFVNSPLASQTNLSEIFDAGAFLKKLIREKLILKDQIIGRKLFDEDIESYRENFNHILTNYLFVNKKNGFDFVFLSSNNNGRVAGIERNCKSFLSKELTEVVYIKKEKELTITPFFLKQSKHIAFLATKSEKRRPLAWLFSTNGKDNESPSFLRFIDNVKERLTVYIDDKALTWPQLEINRESPYGTSTIRLDLAKNYNENTKEKLPVIVLIHGFLGLNSFDGLLTILPSTKYIAAAMHYGTIPSQLPVKEYSNHVMKNIDAVVEFFGSKGHPVYIFDHSMGNIYFLKLDKNFNELNGIKKYLKGRIGANPFFGEEAKHALLGFLDNVILPSMSLSNAIIEKPLLITLRQMIPFDTKKGVRKRGINLSAMLIGRKDSENSNIWNSVKARIIYLMTNLDSLPHLNRIPIENALNKVPAKIFAIQINSALLDSKDFDHQEGLINMSKNNIPVMILKSERDSVAKFVPRLYTGKGCEIIDITDKNENDLFREHLYHMVCPIETSAYIQDFIDKIENKVN